MISSLVQHCILKYESWRKVTLYGWNTNTIFSRIQCSGGKDEHRCVCWVKEVFSTGEEGAKEFPSVQVLPRMRCSEVQMWQWGNEAFTRQRRVNLGNNGHHCTGQTFATTFPSWLLQIVKRLLLWHAFSFFLPQLWSHNMYVRYSRVQIYQIRAPDLTFKFWLERLTCFSCRPGKASPGPGRNLDSSCKLGYCNPCRSF